MAHAKNMAHRLGIHEGAKILCNLDADNMTGKGFAKYIANHFTMEGMDTFLWARMIPGVFARGISGRIVVPAQMFLKAGGYNEQFENWGPDDKDFNARLSRMNYRPFEIPGDYLKGIKHDDRIRFKEYPHVRPPPDSSQEQPIDPCAPNISNNGNIGCGVVKSLWHRMTLPLGHIATRVFGIGMHKTGTTSLCAALTMLGMDCSHWTTARHARTIWEQMRAEGHSVELERYYAATDLPISLLYKELDRAYPGSKFILTLRPEEQWLDSIEAHFSERNPYRNTWDIDCFTHRVHRELYGRKTFDRQTMHDAYIKHNREVLDYFRNRPHDLLLVHMDSNSIWPKLCGFLGAVCPGDPYPRENMTRAS
jgi:hypothetical protein